MKKKINRKPSYKKGGESWVSEKMANLPMYALGAETAFPSTIGFNKPPLNLQSQQNQLDPNSLNYGQNWATNNPLPQMGMNGFSYDPNAVGDLENKPSDILQHNQEDYNTEAEYADPEQFFNPYGGVDIESRIAYGANQLGQGHTGRGVLGLASAGLGMARIGVGAFAAGKRGRYIQNEHNDKVNKALVPASTSLAQNGGMIDFMQDGGYNYNKTGDTNINKGGITQINKNLQSSGLQFDADFAQAYFSQQSKPQQVTPPQAPVQNTNVLGITSDGQFSDRKVWRNQKPEWYVGKQAAVEGKDYTRVPYNQWGNYKTTPEYSKFKNPQNSSGAMHQEGGEQPQGGEDQMMQQVAQALQGGANPEEVLQQLVQAGIPQEQATQMIQAVMQQLQGQQQQAPPQMQRGGHQEYTQYSDRYFQEGGEQSQGQPSPEQIIQAYAQTVQQDPQAIMQQLQQMQPEEQQQALQQMVAALQGGQQSGQEEQLEGQMSNPQEEQQEFQRGGEFAKKLTGEYTTPLDENDPNQNAEVEKREFLQTPDGEITKALGETHERGGTAVNLEGGTRIVSDHLKLGAKNAKHYKENFDLEVKATDTYAKVLHKFTTKSGLQKIVDEQERVIGQLKKSEEAAQGSSISESTTSLNKQFLSQKLEELEQAKTPLEEARKALMNDVFNRQEESKPAEKREDPAEERNEQGEEYQKGGKHQNRFDDRYNEMVDQGYTGTKNIGEMQAWMNQNHPESVVDYFTEYGQPMTAKHMDMIKASYKDVFAKTGISPNKASAAYTLEEKSKMQQALGERATDTFLKEGFNDNKQDWRFPMMGINLHAAGIQPQQISAPKLPNYYQQPETAVIPPQEGVVEEEQKGKGLNLMMMPNQAPMLPDSLEGALKITRRYDRINPMQLSADQQIGDLRSQEAQAIAQINQMPESQRAGAMANLSAITQQNIAKTNSEVNRTNINSDIQAQQFNAQTQVQEENARGIDLQSYENKIMRAKATTDADVRGYYNHLQQADLANYNAVNNVNLMNQMYSNFGYDGNSVALTQGAPKWSANQATSNGLGVTPTKKKTTKKRFGGKTK